MQLWTSEASLGFSISVDLAPRRQDVNKHNTLAQHLTKTDKLLLLLLLYQLVTNISYVIPDDNHARMILTFTCAYMHKLRNTVDDPEGSDPREKRQ